MLFAIEMAILSVFWWKKGLGTLGIEFERITQKLLLTLIITDTLKLISSLQEKN